MKKLLVAGLLLCVFTLGTYAQEKEKKEKYAQRALEKMEEFIHG